MLEKVIACAFRDSKDGKIYLSRMCHAEIIGMFFGVQDKEIGHRCEQGFITNLDRFVDRREALQIARNAKQELHKWCDTDELYSEDIFWNPFEEGKIKELEKIVDLMAEYISGTDIDEDVCKKVDKNQFCDEYGENSNCKECVKNYFKMKVSDKNK